MFPNEEKRNLKTPYSRNVDNRDVKQCRDNNVRHKVCGCMQPCGLTIL